MLIIRILCLTLVVASVTFCQRLHAAAQPTTQPIAKPIMLPADLKNSQDVLTNWVNSFLGKTEADLIKLLGEPTVREVDADGDPHLSYTTSENAKINFSFSKRHRVIVASYGIMSD